MSFPEKIVSLCPSITETLIDLGLSDALVGITRFCIHPEMVVNDLTKVGGTKDPNLEQIRRLDPDLIFMNAEENRKEDYDALIQNFEVDVSEPRSAQEIPALLRHFGQRTERVTRAEVRAQELETELEALKSEQNKSQTQFRYSYLIWRKPWMVVGQETYVSKLFADAGGINVFAHDPQRYPSIELSVLAEQNPDFIFLADEPFPFQDSHVPEIEAACPNAKVRVISGDDCCWHGVRSIRGVQTMRKLVQELAQFNT